MSTGGGAGAGHRPGGWRRGDAVAYVSSADRVALLDLNRLASPAHVLEGPAAAIWDAVDGARTTAEIVDVVAGEYGMAADDVRGDVQGFLASLAELGLIEAL